MNYETLTGTLEAIGKPARTVEMPGGARILLLPHGGRVLGLFGAGDEENYYWTHPALASAATAEAFYASGDWQNSAGIAPGWLPNWIFSSPTIRISTSPDTSSRANSIRATTRSKMAMERCAWSTVSRLCCTG